MIEGIILACIIGANGQPVQSQETCAAFRLDEVFDSQEACKETIINQVAPSVMMSGLYPVGYKCREMGEPA